MYLDSLSAGDSMLAVEDLPANFARFHYSVRQTSVTTACLRICAVDNVLQDRKPCHLKRSMRTGSRKEVLPLPAS